MTPPARKSAKRRPARGPARADAHLLTRGELERIVERILKFSRADETEIEIDAGADALTRFANNAIHQNVAERELVIGVRAVVDGRTARATTNKNDEDSLRRLVDTAASLARFQPRNPDLLPMPGPLKLATVRRFDSDTAASTPLDRARAVKKVVDLAAARKQTAAGIYSTGVTQMVLANSRGLFHHYTQTRAEFSVTLMTDSSSGWAKANSPRADEIDPVALAEAAGRKAEASRSPREFPPGHYTAILEPSAVLDLVGFLFYDFAGTAVLDKRSCFTGRLGQKLFGENINLWDDVYHPLQLGPPYDGEGIPRRRVQLVDRGVVKNLVYARSTAKKMKQTPTGHGLTLPNEYGEAPMNLVFEGGSSSIDRMIASTERGILVTRVWYIREVDPYQKILTGMTRDGTFLVENGRLAGGVRNFRFNESALELLAGVDLLGPAVRTAGEESFEMVVPAMKVRNFHFTEVTKF